MTFLSCSPLSSSVTSPRVMPFLCCAFLFPPLLASVDDPLSLFFCAHMPCSFLRACPPVLRRYARSLELLCRHGNWTCPATGRLPGGFSRAKHRLQTPFLGHHPIGLQQQVLPHPLFVSPFSLSLNLLTVPWRSCSNITPLAEKPACIVVPLSCFSLLLFALHHPLSNLDSPSTLSVYTLRTAPGVPTVSKLHS